MREFTAGDRITLYKQKYRSGEYWLMWQWDETVWHRTDEFILSLEQPGHVFWRADATFLAGRYALFYFYPNAPFHFYELYAAQPPHTFDGWYSNINLPPQRTSDGYRYVDIDLDIWVNPDLTYEVVDQDEYQEHAALYHYPDDLRRTAEGTVEILRDQIRRKQFPFRHNVKTLGEEIAALAAHYQITPVSFSPSGSTVEL